MVGVVHVKLGAKIKFDASGDGRISRSDVAALFESVGYTASGHR